MTSTKLIDQIDAYRRNFFSGGNFRYPTREELVSEWGEDQVVEWEAHVEERRIVREAEVAAFDKREADRAKAEAAQRIGRLVRDADIPARYGQCRFSSLQRDRQPEAYDACQSYVANGLEAEGKPCLMLSGPPGTGKTSLAVATLLATLEATGKASRFVNLTRYLQQLRDATKDDTSTSILDLTEGYALLVIDDLGRQRLTEWGEEQLYALIDTLYAEGRRVVFTTNVSADAFAAVLDEALRSRLVQMCHRLVLAGEDLRASTVGVVRERAGRVHSGNSEMDRLMRDVQGS